MTPTTRSPRTIRSVATKLAANIAGIHRACGPAVAFSYATQILFTASRIMKNGNLIPADRRMRHGIYRWTVNGTTVELDGSYWSAAREMYGRSVYFPTEDFKFNPGSVVVDLGSNIGLFSILAAKAGCRVIAVEAQAGLVRRMDALASRLYLSIKSENALIGSSTGQFHDHQEFLSQPDVEGEVPVLEMNTLMLKHNIEEIDFLKIDIEGSEFGLFSDTSWLPKVRRMAIEVHTDFGSPDFIISTLKCAGFEVDLRDENLSPIQKAIGPGCYVFATAAR